MLFFDSEDVKTLWFLYMYSWGGTVVAGLDAASLCTTPTPPPSSAAWPLGAAAQAAALHSKPGAWLKPRPTGAWQPTGNDQRLLRPPPPEWLQSTISTRTTRPRSGERGHPAEPAVLYLAAKDTAASRRFPAVRLVYASSSPVYGSNTKTPFAEADRTAVT